MEGAGCVEQPAEVAVAGFDPEPAGDPVVVTEPAGDPVVVTEPAVFPAQPFRDGLEDLGRAPQPYSDACGRSPSASSCLACAKGCSLAC